MARDFETVDEEYLGQCFRFWTKVRRCFYTDLSWKVRFQLLWRLVVISDTDVWWEHFKRAVVLSSPHEKLHVLVCPQTLEQAVNGTIGGGSTRL